MSNELQRPGTLSDDARAIDAALARIGGRQKKKNVGAAGAHLLFVIDLTASREHSLRDATPAIAAMFGTVAGINGGIAIKLAYFRGWSECRASGWHTEPDVLMRALEGLSCSMGHTQIAKILRLALDESEGLSAVVYVGDACEENHGKLIGLAGRLRAPVFVFHDLKGADPDAVQKAEPLFRRMAEASGGAYSTFCEGSAAALVELLSAVAAFSAGGAEAVKQVPKATTPEARQLQTRLLLGPGTGGK
jgi:hypothetical protein